MKPNIYFDLLSFYRVHMTGFVVLAYTHSILQTSQIQWRLALVNQAKTLWTAKARFSC